jgi:hypothetical protein
MKRKTAILVAFLVIPIIPCIGMGIRTGEIHAVFVFYIPSLFFSFLLGFPAFLLTKYLRVIKWWSSVIAGVIIGALPALKDDSFLFYVSLGAISGFVFWLIWRLGDDRNP